MNQWKARAEEKGLRTQCPWCRRYVAKELPKGMFTHCNDCNKDVVLIATGEQAFKAEDTDDRIPWPKKDTPEYEEFMHSRDENRKAPGPDIFKDPLFEDQKKLFDGIFSDSPFMKSGPDEDE